jgi:hypothetical protein
MYQRNANRKHRNYPIKKTAIKDENIDRQILAIHAAITKKLLADPSLVEQVFQRLKERREVRRIGYAEYITWYSLLELIDEPNSFMQGMLEDTPRMRKYRRRTPFVNILTEAERRKALYSSAIGELTQF